MSDPVWYYARGETEKGPLSTAQMKALASSGRIHRDDFVWKEGMPNWVVARDLDELFPNEKGSGTPNIQTRQAAADNHAGSQKVTTPRPRPAHERAHPIGRSTVIVGLFIVLVSRGCDSLARLEHQIQSQPQQIQNETSLADPDGEVMLWAFWREAAFLLGTLLLAAGLVTVGYSGEGPERWICLGLLATIVASIYLSHSW